jgi:hypothetical protein
MEKKMPYEKSMRHKMAQEIKELKARIEELEEEKDYWYNMYMNARDGFEVNDL